MVIEIKTMPALSEDCFRAMALAREVDIRRYEDACRFDKQLRLEGLGYAKHCDLRIWYRKAGMAHGRTMMVEDFKNEAIYRG